ELFELAHAAEAVVPLIDEHLGVDLAQLNDLGEIDPEVLVDQRYDRFRRMGQFEELPPSPAPADAQAQTAPPRDPSAAR
ncbi:MAG: hypothetical protein ACF8SC_04365, partial [Phycisphaerales bacterium JB037]